MCSVISETILLVKFAKVSYCLTKTVSSIVACLDTYNRVEKFKRMHYFLIVIRIYWQISRIYSIVHNV